MRSTSDFFLACCLRYLPVVARRRGRARPAIPTGRCTSSSAIRPAAPPTSWRGFSGTGCRDKLGQQFIIENKPGAGNNIGTEVVVKAAPDGYTLLLVNPANTINATLYKNLPFNFLRDIAPVAGIIRVPNVMEVNPAVPAKTVAEFIAYAKANPGKINMASSGNGTSVHLSGELFKMMTGVKMTHVPYKGSAPALTDLIGGQVQVMFDNLPSSIGAHQGRQAARAGGDHGERVGRTAGRADRRRDGAGLRGERVLRLRRAARARRKRSSIC